MSDALLTMTKAILVGLLISAAMVSEAEAGEATSCTAILECVARCAPLTQECIQGCEQGASPDQAAHARTALTCITQSGCKDASCTARRCTSELAACSSHAPAGDASGAGGIDLVYQVPPGWSEQRGNGVVTLGFQKDVQDGTSFYGTRRYRLLILPGRPLRGTLAQAYQALWDEVILSSFTPTLAPAPMRRRLASGLLCAFDGELMKAKNGNEMIAVLYVIAAADRVVPVLGLYDRADDSTEAPLIAFFNALTIRGAKPSKAPLYAPSELVGEWSTMDTSHATYVDSRGNYVGDASITVAETYRLDDNGGFRSSLVGLRGTGPNVKESHAGTWKIDDGSLVMEAKDFDRRIRVFGVGRSPSTGKPALYLPPSYSGDAVVDFWMPRRNKAQWFGKITK